MFLIRLRFIQVDHVFFSYFANKSLQYIVVLPWLNFCRCSFRFYWCIFVDILNRYDGTITISSADVKRKWASLFDISTPKKYNSFLCIFCALKIICFYFVRLETSFHAWTVSCWQTGDNICESSQQSRCKCGAIEIPPSSLENGRCGGGGRYFRQVCWSGHDCCRIF